ncbi:MAG: hypothetical protein IT578_01480 [Verrucomicrobiae bacterium]|nr:hypothetical protein [Verrucomicrobiae bacterium]
MKLSRTRLVVALLAAGVAVAHAEPKVVRGDPSQLPRPDLTRQIERKSVEDLQKSFETKSISVGAVEMKAWGGAAPSLPRKSWNNSRGDYYARSLQIGAFEAREASDGVLTRKEPPFARAEWKVSPSAFEGRASEIHPKAVPAEAVELPEDLAPEDVRARFRTTPVIQTGVSGGKHPRGRATEARETAPVRVGVQPVEQLRARPENPAPRTPSASP